MHCRICARCRASDGLAPPAHRRSTPKSGAKTLPCDNSRRYLELAWHARPAPGHTTLRQIGGITAVDGVDAPRLWVELTSSSGTIVRGGEVSTPVPDRPLDVYFPGSLTAGRYQLVVRERKGGKELARSAFDVHD